MFVTLPGEDRTIQKKRWNEVRAKKPWLDLRFKEQFPNKHRDSLKPMVESLASRSSTQTEEGDSIFDEIHPLAWDLLLEYGKDYVPRRSMAIRALNSHRQPAERQCFMNSFERLMSSKLHNPHSKVVYVEGVVAGPAVHTMLHAWNAEGFSRNAFDWTLYSEMEWTRYFGIPFTFIEYMRLLEAGGKKYASIFSRDSFEKIENEVRKILNGARIRHPKEPPTFIEITIPIVLTV